jgi:hypothetical protein
MNIRNYISTDIAFAAFVVTVALSTIMAILGFLSYFAPYIGIELATTIPTEMEQLGMFGALLLAVFFMITEVVDGIS